MDKTRWNFEPIGNEHQATNSFQNQLEVPFYQSILYPSGGLYSTPKDLSKYLIGLLKNHEKASNLINNVAFQEMISPQTSNGTISSF